MSYIFVDIWKQCAGGRRGSNRSIYWIDAFLSINIDVSLDWIHLHTILCMAVAEYNAKPYDDTFYLKIQGRDLQKSIDRFICF